MRVATFNIHHGTVGVGGPVDADQLGEVCAGLDADVIALQEVEAGTPRTWGAHLARAVARACGGELVVGPTQRIGWAYQANALVVRGEVHGWSNTGLPRVPARRRSQERRSLLRATVDVAGGRWTVATTHLALEHAVSDRQLATALAALGTGPGVLLGDLNRRPNRVRPQAAAAGLTYVEHGPTYPAGTPTAAIDHVLVTPGVSIRAVEVRSTTMSDHAALLVDLGYTSN